MKISKWFKLAGLVLCMMYLLCACGGGSTKSSGSASSGGNDSSNVDTDPEQKSGTQFAGDIRETVGGISTGEHKVIATVNGEDIYEDVFTEWFLETMSLNFQLDMSSDQDEHVVDSVNEYKAGYLTMYAEQVALLQEAVRSGILVDDAAVDSYRAMLMSMYTEEEAQFQPLLAMWGFSDESLRSFLWEKMVIQFFYEEITKDIVEPSISPEDYYKENPLEFAVDETRTVRHILVETAEEAQEIIGELDGGADFADYVERSLDTASIPSGGVIGPFYPSGIMVSGTTLVSSFTEASYALEGAGAYTKEPAESEYGYHIIILDNITEPYTESFDDIADDLNYYLLTMEREAYFEAYCQEIINQSDITYVE